tara:strand:+ start:130 stop:504 length:375 start_codon:yes stop_codon:yes gene_type:complete
MTSQLNVDTIADKAGTGPVALTKQEAAKVWGVLNTATERGTFGVSGTTDHGTGDQTVTVTSAFSDVNYSFVGTASNTGTEFGTYLVDYSPNNARSTTALRFWTGSYNSLQDSTYNNFVIHGGLA